MITADLVQDAIPEHDEYRAMPHSLRLVLVRPLPCLPAHP